MPLVPAALEFKSPRERVPAKLGTRFQQMPIVRASLEFKPSFKNRIRESSRRKRLRMIMDVVIYVQLLGKNCHFILCCELGVFGIELFFLLVSASRHLFTLISNTYLNISFKPFAFINLFSIWLQRFRSWHRRACRHIGSTSVTVNLRYCLCRYQQPCHCGRYWSEESKSLPSPVKCGRHCWRC